MNKIKFIYHNELAYQMIQKDTKTKPSPSKNFIPDWHKKMTPYEESNNIIIENKISNATAKKCMPMLDAITSGYTIPLWCDIQIKQEKNILDNKFYPKITWRINLNVFEVHGNSSRNIPSPFGYSQIVFKFITYFNIKTPSGYSIFVSNPSGHYNLPFYAIPGIIDSDKSVIDNNFPCWVQEGFEGIVEKGTPIAQVTPFKRCNWKSTFLKIPTEQYKINYEIGFNSNILNNYVKNIWSKKNYE